jgi:hypothetical protein
MNLRPWLKPGPELLAEKQIQSTQKGMQMVGRYFDIYENTY